MSTGPVFLIAAWPFLSRNNLANNFVIGPSEREKTMRSIRAAAALVVCLFIASAVTAACPTTPPAFFMSVSYAGANCASALGGTCGVAQPVSLTIASSGFGDTGLQPCDTVTWHYGDGVTETKAQGVFTTTHVYAAAGNYPVSVTVSNSLGTSSSFFSTTPTIPVGNGLIQLTSDFCCGISVKEGLPASFTVQRTSGTGTASVHFDTADGTAFAGQQYVATSGTLTFAPGEIQKSVPVQTIDDGVFRINSLNFHMTLSAPTGGFLLGTHDMFVSITESDARPIIAFESSEMTTTEGAGTFNVRILRSGDTSPAVSVAYSIQNASTKPATVNSTGILSFLAGETSKTIAVPVLPTSVYDGNRLISVSMQNPTNGAAFPNNSFSTNAIITVKDEQPEPVVMFDNLSVTEGNSGTKIVNEGVTLSNPAGFDLVIRPSLIDGSAHIFRDFTWSGNSFVIPAGQTAASFPIQIFGNTAIETDKQFTISATVSRDCCTALSLRVQNGQATILNDDSSISPVRLTIAKGSSQSIIAKFGGVPSTPQFLSVSSSDPSVATVPASISINAATIPIDVTAKSAGLTTITTTFPAAFGGGTFTTEVYVYEGASLVLSPASISIPVGGTATISASFKPAQGITDGAVLKAMGPGKITVPDRVTIDAGQTSTFTITGVQHGYVEIVATLGSNHGNAVVAFVEVQVTDAPTTPAITQILPSNGPAAGGTAVTLNGLNLRNDCTIRFGDVPAASSAFVSATSMTATTPEHAPGSVDVVLACGTDRFNFTNGFTYLAASATLSNVTPSFGNTSGNTLVKITGTNFASGCWPFFDGIPARAATVNSPAEMIASTPGHAAAGTVPLLLRCSGASDASLANAFTYSTAAESSPVITGVDPLVGSSGKPVTITGARFRNDDAVTFDSAPAAVLSTSPGTHVVRIPDLPLGRISITVTEITGRSSTTGPIFTIIEPQPPQITGISPATTRPANEVTLEGSGFRPGYSFVIGDQPATLLSLDYTRVVLRVPQLAAGAYAVNVLNAASKIAAVGPQLQVLPAGLAVTRVSPVCATTDGGEPMTISGTGFSSGAVVTFNGAIAAGAIVADAQTINVTLPPLPAGAIRIVVANANGDSASLSGAFNVTSPFDPNGCSSRARPSRH